MTTAACQIQYGKDARIAHQVFIVMEAELAKSFTASTSFDVSVNAGSIQVTGEGLVGTSGRKSVAVSNGSVFAYGMVKLDWDAHRAKNKTTIVKGTDDQWGLN
jgi:hypothetical protein